MNNNFKVAFLAVIAASLLYASLNAYQAVTGKRISKLPSRRTDEEMRNQSAIAAVVLGVVSVLGLLLVLSMK